MSLEFTVESPLLDGKVMHEAHRRYALRAVMYLAAAVVCAILGGVFLSRVAGEQSQLIFFLGLAVMFLAALTVWKAAACADAAHACTPLREPHCQDALGMANDCPELEAYRRRVVSARRFMYGDYHAMAEYLLKRPGQDACRALHQVGAD